MAKKIQRVTSFKRRVGSENKGHLLFCSHTYYVSCKIGVEIISSTSALLVFFFPEAITQLLF